MSAHVTIAENCRNRVGVIWAGYWCAACQASASSQSGEESA